MAAARGGPSDRRELWRWLVRGSGLGLGLLLVAIATLGVQEASGVVVLVLVSILLAAALDPLVEAVRDRVALSRAKVILAVYVLLVMLATILVVLVVPAAVSQLSELSARLPGLIDDGRDWARSIEPEIVGTALERIIDTLERSFMVSGVTAPDPETIVEFGLTAADAVIGVLTVLTLVFFWLVSRETIQRFTLSMLPMRERRPVRRTWNEMESRMGYWLRGQLTLMSTVGVLATVAYLVLGLENALLLGLIAGVAEIIPIVGPAIGAVPALISAFITGGPELALLVAGVYVVIQVIEGNVLVPIVMKNAVGLPPFVVIVSLLAGAAVAGLAGALLAVPVAAGLAVVLEHAQARSTSVALETPDLTEEGDEKTVRKEQRSRLAPWRAGGSLRR